MGEVRETAVYKIGPPKTIQSEMPTVLSWRNPGLEALSNDRLAHQKQVTKSSSLEHGSTGVCSKNRNELRDPPQQC